MLGLGSALLCKPDCTAEVLRVSMPSTPVASAPLDAGQGANTSPAGTKLEVDSLSFLRDGRRFMPVSGEFHFSRYPRSEWRSQLLKMKAGGIDIVSTYVFWIHHEEEQGHFDWSGDKDLHAFLELCKETGLLAIVRLGPWDHGEVRNGGFPDWVQHAQVKLRSTDPSYLALVRPFYEQMARQMRGLYWKDGGPVIGAQVDNECNGIPYLLSLKALAREFGVDVPYYTMTGWDNVAIPDAGLLPLFGSYSVAFWYPQGKTSYRKSFVFSVVRDDKNLGPALDDTNPARSALIARFPYLCCEIGGGMMNAYAKRVQVDPEEIASMALTRLGCGNNMPGYYMYQGGINPAGRHSSLNEFKPNAMPVMDYDFQAPLAATGLARPQFHSLRQQHLFVHDFGEALAAMHPVMPERQPASLDDLSVPRWCLRSDGRSGFVFFGNYQPETAMPVHRNIQFRVTLPGADITLPSTPFDLASGAYGFLPVNLDCHGVTLRYATAQPLCRVEGNDGFYYFFSEIPGVPVEVELAPNPVKLLLRSSVDPVLAPDGGALLRDLKPGLRTFATLHGMDGTPVYLVLLSQSQARQLQRLSFHGRDLLVLSEDLVYADGDSLRLETEKPGGSFSIFPVQAKLTLLGGRLRQDAPGQLFTRYTLPEPAKEPLPSASLTLVNPSKGDADTIDGSQEADWAKAERWTLHISKMPAGRRFLCRIDYAGDAARVLSGERLLLDNFSNGTSLELPLWRLPADQAAPLSLLRIPYGSHSTERLPASVRAGLGELEALRKRQPVLRVSEIYEYRLDLR
jgi:hypothetical protein